MLLPNLRSGQTAAFSKGFLSAVRSSSRLNRESAEKAAKDYLAALGTAGLAVPASPDDKDLPQVWLLPVRGGEARRLTRSHANRHNLLCAERTPPAKHHGSFPAC